MVRCLLPHSLLRMASARCKPLKPPPQSLNSPSVAKFLPLCGADCSALRRTIFFLGGGAPKKAASKNEKYKNTQLAAAVPELEEP